MTTPQPYVPPSFAEKISSYAPAYRLKLAMRPTPIQSWNLRKAIADFPKEISVSIKRDDMTGVTTSGNKIRKLEFLLADALMKGCDTVITAGGVQSNHARTTAVAAKELGMTSHVFLRTQNSDKPHELKTEGNILIHKLIGSEIHLIRPVSYTVGILPKMKELSKRLQDQGRNPYLIGIGGSDHIGLWGYIEAFAEMIEQGVCDHFSDIVVPVGSGGTASGLAIANYLSGSRVRIHAVTVCDSPDYFYGHLDEMLSATGLQEETSAREILHIIEGEGRGYARNTDEELELGVRLSCATGIMLDPVYTLKGLHGLLTHLKSSLSVFKEEARLLFIHTGGIFSLYDNRVAPFLDHSRANTWVSQD